MIKIIRENLEKCYKNDEYFYLLYFINPISGLFVNKNRIFYAIKNFQNIKTENIKTDLLALQTNRLIITTDNNNSLESGYYNLIEFKDDINSENFDSFISLCIMHSNIADEKPINSFFNSLINLFQVPREQHYRNIVGLFGELYFIKYIYDTYNINIVNYWHQMDSNDKFDFKFKNMYVEVKTTLKNNPIVKIKHQQIFNYNADKLYLVVNQIQENYSGKTLLELSEEIKLFCDNTTQYVFALKMEEEKRKITLFDYKNKKFSVNNLSIYKVSNLKTINDIPTYISDIKYSYDFTTIDSISFDKCILEKNL